MLPLRLVVDTNVVISAALKPGGLQRTVLVFALAAPARVFISLEVVAEYSEVLSRPELRIPAKQRNALLKFILDRGHMIAPARKLAQTLDPDDNIFLECAEESRADYLITGNKRHFPAFWKNTKIVTTREFLDVVAPHLLG